MRFIPVVLIAMAVAVFGRSDAVPHPLRDSTVLVLYVGAEDCAPCRAWQANDGAAFRSSAYFPQIVYREVRAPHLRTLLNDENWPGDIRNYRDALRRSDGVPLWFVVAGEKVVQRQAGSAQWRTIVLPAIKQLL
jgi:hypothetical protein